MKIVAEFQVRYSQLLDPKGQLASDAPAFARETAELVKMYRAMALARAFDTKAINLQRTGKLGTYASCLGHEATHVGIGAAMKPDDVLVPVYREYGAQLWRGVPMSNIFRYWGGDEAGCHFPPPAHQDYPWCVPIGSQTVQGAGVAMAFKVRGEPRASVTFIGDGGTSEGAFYEAMNVAGARELPAIFVIVNNGWAISVPLSSQTAAKTLAQKAIAAGIPGMQVDGNDIVAVRHAAEQALERARSGGGPAVIEAITYRLSDHTTADDASRYRPAEEVEKARGLEPLIRVRAHLTSIGAWDAAREEALKVECAREVEAAALEYLNAPRRTTDAMFDHLYARMPKALRAQRELARRYAGSSGH